jgi:hypothetical protein
MQNMPGTHCPAARSISALPRQRDFWMDPQDQALLDKQLRNLHVPQRRDGVVIATIVAVFLGGIVIGGALGGALARPREPAPSAVNPQIAAALIDTAPSLRQ